MAAAVAMMFSACSNDNDFDWEEEREAALKEAAVDFVDKTVIPVYHDLADAALKLSDLCADIEESVRSNTATDIAQSGTLCSATSALLEEACEVWYEARKQWELSEAFLFGAADDYGIDPHIDTWPLDADKLQTTLDTPSIMDQMDAEYVGSYLGQGLLGFHAVEYMIFDIDADVNSQQGKARTASYKRIEELVYLSAVAEDLANQCVRLEAAWAGESGVSSAKWDRLDEAELLPTFDYGESMRNAGQGGSKYKSYLDAAQEILLGCSDIADEVANQKIARPNMAASTSLEDLSYIESPYAKNSKQDFYDNIVSVRNAYLGTNSSDASVGAYLAETNPDVDRAVRDAITAALSAIDAAPAPFVKYKGSRNAQWQAATEACNELVTALDNASRVIGQ